jgi:DeoR/GlpR family transcriptional regulator of sugar metabolism
VCGLDDVSSIITDQPLPDQLRSTFREAGARVLFPSTD